MHRDGTTRDSDATRVAFFDDSDSTQVTEQEICSHSKKQYLAIFLYCNFDLNVIIFRFHKRTKTKAEQKSKNIRLARILNAAISSTYNWCSCNAIQNTFKCSVAYLCAPLASVGKISQQNCNKIF